MLKLYDVTQVYRLLDEMMNRCQQQMSKQYRSGVVASVSDIQIPNCTNTSQN